MKTALIAAGALLATTLTGLPDASAKDLKLGLTIGGPDGFIHISGPGPKHHSKHGSKGYGYGGQGYNPYQKGYGNYPGYGRGYGNNNPYRGQNNVQRGRAHGYCMYPREIRRMLRHQGWQGFRIKKLTSGIAVIHSNRHGMPYRLKIDRCTGQILKAKPKGGYGGYGPRGYY